MPSNTEFEIRGGYVPFTLKRNPRLDLYTQALNKLDEASQKTRQQTSAIEAAIAEADLNEAEDKWKQDYVDDIKNQINIALRDNPLKGLSTAIKLGGESVSNPAFRGRLRYNENRKKWLSDLETRAARNEIDSDTLARAKYENAYNYKDNYDDTGRIVGGSDWKPRFEPVKDINLDQVMREIKALVTPSATATSSTGGTSQIYLDSEGNQTTDRSKASGIYATVHGGGSSRSSSGVTAKQWADAYDAWKREHPESAAQFEQKRQNTIWRYKQELMRSQDTSLSEDERKSAKANADVQYSYLTDDSGALLTPENYARSIANPMFKVMQFSDTRTASQGGSTLLDENTLKNKTLAKIYGMTVQQAEIYGISSPIEKYNLLKNISETTAGLTAEGKAAMASLENSFKDSSYNFGK